ncbi:uncharacterized protein LOC133178247 [Saccostrea echinata]|uniref:uncharacterized protein LOC133178247 n=1 Tax=Saccostrea echinata TaxID=191078 RepID=UPI002A7F7811|nr:uncharacterized protein LOC133178247 [Saccostrea echinata]
MPNKSEQESGIPVLGLEDGRFYSYHVTALVTIGASLSCVIAIFWVSFRSHSYKSFFLWTVSDRFVVYLATCDGLFNLTHVLDHVQMVVTKSHVYPKGLCVFYAFLIVVFTTAQALLVLVIALNSFSLVILEKTVKFGAYDWRLLIFMFGIPTAEASVAAFLGQLGPTGSFCGIPGKIALMVMATVPVSLILVVTCSIYVFIWCRVRWEIGQLQLSKQSQSWRHSHNAAKIMTLFVTAFVVQWTPISASGIISFFGDVPVVLDYLVITCTNMGGVFNGLAFFVIQIMRKRQKNRVVQPQVVLLNAETVKPK